MNVSPLSTYTFGPNAARAEGQVVQKDGTPDPTFNDETVHTFAKGADGATVELKFSDLLKASQSGPSNVGPGALESNITAEQKSLDDQRKAALTGDQKEPDIGRAIPKDDSFHPTDYLMFADPQVPLDLNYAQRMAQVGQVEGFHVDLLTPTAQVATVQQACPMPNVTVSPTEAKADTWSEDYGERTFGGGVVIPAHIADDDKSIVSRAILDDRISRFYGADQVPSTTDPKELKAQIKAKFPLADFNQLGAVSRGDYQELLIGASQTDKWPIKEGFGSFEGGNVMTGTLKDGEGYALVGRDTLAVSKARIAEDLGHPVDDATALKLLAGDLGVDAKNIHAIEQPGEFHLDMRIMAAAPGEVVLNDSRKAYEVESAWARADYQAARPTDPSKLDAWKADGAKLDDELKAMKAEDDKRAQWEDLSARDLNAAGLQVDRMAAVFTDLQKPDRDTANFVNGRGGTDANGGRFLIGLGATDREEAYAADQLLNKIPTGLDRIHFLDHKLTQDTLDQFGGIKCRTKPFGTEDTIGELNNPLASELQKVA